MSELTQKTPQEMRAEWRARNIAQAAIDRERAKLRDDWAAGYGLKEAGGTTCACRLANKHHGRFGCQWGDPPGIDHPSLWNYHGTPTVFVFQPYGLTDETRARLADYAKRHALMLRIADAPAWHNPGHVLHVELWRTEETDAVEYERAVSSERDRRNVWRKAYEEFTA